ncbi:PAS domain-containing sensor histidine kinase [Stigmatella aurantiaca]|uniref:histidine kinase n=1 Tax=Stigmatella aurantiaca (strain DW4/3-1) TaxID=378806 RepID=Q09AD3_STIAD|nr:PAS domain-containing sensor histidine kinase [Stigmatella aurantiaca]ADO75019.1 Sensor protein [Stigmatella aurantiaca DW4/3-1]EAU68632.1 Two-component system protein A [Stigmatella aurantiaca DW4/3-1]
MSHEKPTISGAITYAQPRSPGSANEQLRLFIESVKDYAILTLDPEGYVASWNAGAERIKGYRAGEILGQHFSRFYPEKDVAQGKPLRGLEIAEREGRYEEEGWRVRKDGTFFWANVVITALHDESGRLVGFGKVTRDFTQRKQAEEQRELARLRAAVQSQDEFLSVASHELKTPLTPLQLKLTSLLRTVQGHPEATMPTARIAKELEGACRQVRKLADLIDSLLDVSRLSVQRVQLSPALMDLSSLVRDVVARHVITATQVSSPVVVEAPVPVEGSWDWSRLEQVVTHLLSNALKYGAGKPVHIQVSVEEGSALLAVRDEGIGIEEEQQARVFERFARAVSDRHYGGLGLGLFIAQQVIEAHGGTLSVESSPGRGALFTARLPLGPSPGKGLRQP